jgi:hypothetical protein
LTLENDMDLALMDPALTELLFTAAACASLVILFLASAAVLPWSESELEEVEQGVLRLAEVVLGEPIAQPAPAASRFRAA